MGAVFLVGTEIGVGKTVVAGALARAAVIAGARPAFFKPFVTDDNEDMYVVLSAAMDAMKRPAKGFARAPIHCSSEYSLNSHASPYTAVIEEEGGIDVDAVLGSISDLYRASGTVIVEGSGNMMTPICRRYLMADIVADTAMPLVVVTTNRIGALSLATMSARSCRERGRPPAGFVINCIDPYGYAPGQLAEDIRAVTGIPVLAVLDMHGERPAQKRKGSLFGSLPPQAGADGGIDGARLPEGLRRSVAAAAAAYKSGRLDGVAGMLLGRDDLSMRALRGRGTGGRMRQLAQTGKGSRGAGARRGKGARNRGRGRGAP